MRFTLGFIVVLAGCSEANHLGNPLLLPVTAIGAAIENASYDRRRAAVKAWIVDHEAQMRAEGFEGPVTEALLESLPQGRRMQARQDLKQAAAFSDFSERATVIVMVLAG